MGFGGRSWPQGLGNWFTRISGWRSSTNQRSVLSADWRMNVGRGVITMEKWVKQSDGNWLLEQDDFEVVEQFST